MSGDLPKGGKVLLPCSVIKRKVRAEATLCFERVKIVLRLLVNVYLEIYEKLEKLYITVLLLDPP